VNKPIVYGVVLNSRAGCSYSMLTMAIPHSTDVEISAVGLFVLYRIVSYRVGVEDAGFEASVST